MSRSENRFLEQDQNTAKLIINTFYKVVNDNGVSANDITKHLRQKFGNVWKLGALTNKTEEILKRSAALGFLGRQGDRYVANLARGLRCRRRRRRCCRRRPRRRRCRRRSRRRRRCCR